MKEQKIIMYGLQNIIGEVPKGIIILLIAYFLGNIQNLLYISINNCTIQMFSGGVHMKTHIGWHNLYINFV